MEFRTKNLFLLLSGGKAIVTMPLREGEMDTFGP